MIPSPSPADSLNILYSVSARTADDAWAVGRTDGTTGGPVPLIMQWNGTAWNQIAAPGTDSIGAGPSVVAVTTTPQGDAWFVGQVTLPPSLYRTVVYRRSGGAWTSVRGVRLSPMLEYPYSERSGIPWDIDATASDDVWIVGTASGYGDGQAFSIAMVLHWDGSQWMEFDTLGITNRSNQLHAVDAVSPTDVWAVGHFRDPNRVYHGLIYHWDGAVWQHIPHLWESASFETAFSEVKAFAADDVWVFGGPDFLHWNGSNWETITPPPNGAGVPSADGPAADDFWATMSYSGIYHHFDGQQWAVGDTLSLPGATEFYPGRSLSAVPGGVTWSVGHYVMNGIIHTFTARLQPGLPEVNDLTLATDGNTLMLRWSAVAEADVYDLYEISGDQPTLLATTPDLSHTIPVPLSPSRRYYVVARQIP